MLEDRQPTTQPTLQRLSIAILLGICGLCAVTAYLIWAANPWLPPVHYDCSPRANDPEGYMVAICQHLNQNGIRVGDWDRFEIRDTREETFAGREAVMVILSCCGTGDTAYIDKQTGEVLGYMRGAY